MYMHFHKIKLFKQLFKRLFSVKNKDFYKFKTKTIIKKELFSIITRNIIRGTSFYNARKFC